MNYRPELEERVLWQMTGLPSGAFDMLVQTLARICSDPYDRLVSAPVGYGQRMAELGDHGFITFAVDDNAMLIRVYDLVWTARSTSRCRRRASG